MRAVLGFAEKLTLQPASVERSDLAPSAYFNFVNRLADGLGVALEGR